MLALNLGAKKEKKKETITINVVIHLIIRESGRLATARRSLWAVVLRAKVRRPAYIPALRVRCGVACLQRSTNRGPLAPSQSPES